MRAINLDDLELPAGWEARAATALADVAGASDADRSDEIAGHSDVWRDLKGALAELSHDKCWYCETRQIRSDNNVDHYRPKARPVERPDHPGYWWLAFEPTNFRYSCTFCNSHRKDKATGGAGGKHNHFPVADEAQRAMSPADDLNFEDASLLDPVVAADPPMLWFEPDGRAVPRFDAVTSMRWYERAERSIELYHLDYFKLKRRRKSLFRKVNNLVTNGSRYFPVAAAGGNALVGVAFRQVVEDLIRLVRSDAEHSAAARAYLGGFRNRTWVDAMLAAI